MSQHRIGRRPLAVLLSLALTSGTLAELSVLTTTVARADDPTVCNQPSQDYFTGVSSHYVVPAGTTSVSVVASGAEAANDRFSGVGGNGATVSTTLTVTPGQVLDLSVGVYSNSASGGLSGGLPSGGSVSNYQGTSFGTGGGGATFVSSGGTVLVAAGGGGGAGYAGTNFAGNGTGGNAGPASLTSTTGVFAGGNGSALQGSVATGGSTTVGTGGQSTGGPGNGHDGNGQVGGDSGSGSGAGGGGGGYQGGGGGGDYAAPAGGGAGSSYSVAPYTIIGGRNLGGLTITAVSDPDFQSADSGRLIENQYDDFQVCAPGGAGTTLSYTGDLPPGVAFTDNGNGIADLAGTPTETGSFPLTFTATRAGITRTQSFTLVVHDVTPTTFAVTASPSLSAGGTVTGTVTALDAQGEVAASDWDTVGLTSTDPLASLDGPVQLVDGVGSFTGTLSTAGTQTVTATDGAVVGTSNDIAVASDAAISYTVVLPGTATAGATVDAVIDAKDQYGNTATDDNDDVSLTSTDVAASLSPTVAFTAGTVTVPVVFVSPGAQTVSVSGSTLSASSNVVTVSAGTTVQLSASTPNDVTAGSVNTINVVPQDVFGNPTGSTDTLHFASTDPAAVLPADGQVNTMGAASLTFKTAGSQTVTVTDVTNPAVTASSIPVTVEPGSVESVAGLAGDQQSTPAGHAFSTRLSVLVTDAEGNPVPDEVVVFATSDAGLGSFSGTDTTIALSDSSGLATSSRLSAGTTVGDVRVNATATGAVLVQCTSTCSPTQRTPVSHGSTTFTEHVTLSDAAVAATPKTSSGAGTAAQSTQVTLPAHAAITLLDSSGNPVTSLITANGTYLLDPSTGVINFVAMAGFVGTAVPITYQVTDAYDLEASSTYTPTVTAAAPVNPVNPVSPPPVVSPPTGVAQIRTAAQVVLTGSTVPATCTVTVAAIGSCQTGLTAQVSGRQVVLGISSTVQAQAGATTVATVIHLNSLGRALAAQVGGVTATAWASVTKSDGRLLSAKGSLTLVDRHVTVGAAVLFPAKQSTLTAAARRQLKALKARLGAVSTITCTGYGDSRDAALGTARAKAVCAALALHGVTLVTVGHGTTGTGQALSRRVKITLTY